MTAGTSGPNSSAIARADETPRGMAFATRLNERHRRRGGRPSSRSPPKRRAPGPTYHAAARLRPKLYSPSPTPEGRHRINRKRTRREEPREESYAIATPSSPSQRRPTKKPRVSPLPDQLRASASFLSSDLLRRRYGGSGLIRRRSDTKAVTFAYPLVTDSWTRPCTPPEDVEDLFYRKADEVRFRQEVRVERSKRRLWLRQRREEESSDSDGDEETCQGVDAKSMTATVITSVSSSVKAEEDPNEVTESDDSSDSDESGGGSSSDEEQ